MGLMVEYFEAESKKSDWSTAPSVDIPVFFASDRLKITSNKNDAGKVLAPLHLGECQVRVPCEKEWQSSATQLKEEFQNLNWQLELSAPAIKPYIDVRGYVADRAPQAAISEVQENAKDFWSDLRSEVQRQKEHKVFVYIHGFAASGENALYASGILASQVQAPVVAFTWPSAGTVGLKYPHLAGSRTTRALFRADRKMIDDPQVESDLSTFVSELKKELPADTQVEIVAHSLGNRLLTKHLHGKSRDQFDNVYFLAPDVDKKLFLSAVPDILAKSNHVSVFMNPHDRVLQISGLNNLLELHSWKKLGKSKVSAAGIDFIDYGAVAKPRGIGHYIPFEHFGSLLRNQTLASPDGRKEFILTRRSRIEKISRDFSQLKDG